MTPDTKSARAGWKPVGPKETDLHRQFYRRADHGARARRVPRHPTTGRTRRPGVPPWLASAVTADAPLARRLTSPSDFFEGRPVPCIGCGVPTRCIGVFSPDDPAAWRGRPGQGPNFVYPIHPACFRIAGPGAL